MESSNKHSQILSDGVLDCEEPKKAASTAAQTSTNTAPSLTKNDKSHKFLDHARNLDAVKPAVAKKKSIPKQTASFRLMVLNVRGLNAMAK